MTKYKMQELIVPKIARLLSDYDWKFVRNAETGILYKDGYVLQLGCGVQNLLTERLDDGCVYAVSLNFDASTVNGKVNGWFIEKNGYVVANGIVSSGAENALVEDDVAEKDAQELQFLLNRINCVTEKSDAALTDDCFGFDNVLIPETVYKFTITDSKLRDTMMFAVLKDGYSIPKNIYRVVVVDGDVLECIAVSLDSNGELLVASGRRLRFPVDEYKQGAGKGDVRVVASSKVNQTVEKRMFVKTDFSYYSVPEELLDLQLTRKHLLNVQKGIKVCANVTPLLCGYDTVSDYFLEALTIPVYGICDLCDKKIEADCMDLIGQVLKSQYSLARFYQSDAEYLKMLLNDFETDCAAMKPEYGIVPEDEALYKIMMSYGRAVTEDKPVHEQFLEFRGEQEGLLSVATEIAQMGNFTGEFYSMSWREVSAENKKKLFKYFALKDLAISEGISWADILAGIFEQIQYLKFYPDLGFIISTIFSDFGRDDNSVIAYYDNKKPRWRGIRINEKSFWYGDESVTGILTNSFYRHS